MSRRPVSLAHSGLVIVDKPAGMTSHDVVSVLRRAFQTRRVGHAGTLDPAATGVLVVGIERGTKLLPFLVKDSKSYQATILIGQATSTEDADGDVTVTDSREHLDRLTETDLHTAAAQLTGDIEQVPSAVSAIKVNGVRAYQRVRQGETVDLPPRPVHIYEFTLSHIRRTPEGWWLLDAVVSCSSGTYVRALARDLAAAVGAHAHLTELRRTRVGAFDLSCAQPLDVYRDAIESGTYPSLTLDLDAATQMGRETRHLSTEEATKVALGQRIAPNGMSGIYAGVDPDNHTIALLEEEKDAKGIRIVRSVFVARPATLQ